MWEDFAKAAALTEEQFEADNAAFAKYLRVIEKATMQGNFEHWSNDEVTKDLIEEAFSSGSFLSLGMCSLIMLHRVSGESIPELTNELEALRVKKGMDYQNSFRLIGLNGLWVMITTKLLRLASLESRDAVNKPVIDSWMDLAGYCGLMFVCTEGRLLEGTRNGYIGPRMEE